VCLGGVGRLRRRGRRRRRASAGPVLRYLVRAVEEVHGHAEGQRVVVGVPQQDGQDLHAGRPGLALPLLLGALQGPLAVDGVLTHLRPGEGVLRWPCDT